MKLKYAIILLITLLFTVFAAYNTVSTYRIAKHASEDQLQSTAYFIGITLDQALNRVGIDQEFFLDVIQTQPWQEIAFIALYDRHGKILLHSSKRLIGKSETDPIIKDGIEKAGPQSSYRELKTGETVYIMDIPIHIHALSSPDHLLRVALHTVPSEKKLLRARIHALTAFIFVFFLWVLALAYFRYSKRIDEFQNRELEKRHLVMLGGMAAVLAHEIRSPLSAIKGFAQYMREKTESDPSVEEGLSVIISESQRLERLTEDLLVFSRAGQMRPAQFSLSELIEEVEGLFVHNEKAITITRDLSTTEDTVYSDREKLRHVLINIIQNAIDSIRDRGSIDIKGWGDASTFTLVVKDTGEGMEPKTLQNALNPFFTTKAKGIGLGLAIVENLLKALHGELQMDSRVNQGTIVTVSLPRTLT